jgi:hypothetical protein
MNMKILDGTRPLLAFGIVVLTSFFFVGEMADSQVAVGKHDLGGAINAFSNYTHDFQAATKTVKGEEVLTTSFLENVSVIIEERLTSLKYTLQIYDTISSKTDRDKVRSLVKEQLALNTYLINYDTERVGGMLSFVKVPAIAQTGLKMKDDMRAAKAKLDSIIDSLE